MPTSTDLVTDLPADFEVFGQAVDTALADLKGGTTNQVLAKNSNTDMDFKWVADASGIPASSFTAKGDLLVGTGSGTYVAQTVGANGTVLTANSAQADGVEWASPASGGMTLLSTTTLSGATTTISSINQTYNTLFVLIKNVNVAANKYIEVLPNNAYTGSFVESSCNTTTVSTVAAAASQLRPYGGNHNLKAATTSNACALTIYNYASTTDIKPFDSSSSHENGSSARCATLAKGAINTNSAITSLVISSDASTFNGGTVLVYGVK